MSKSSKVNRRNVLSAIRGGGVTGTDLRSCAVSVVASLKADPYHVGKVEEILRKLLKAKVIERRDAQVHCVVESQKPARSNCDRAALRKAGRIDRLLNPPRIEPVPLEWVGVDPDEYDTRRGLPSDEDKFFEFHLEVCAEKRAIEDQLLASVASQFLDECSDKMGIPIQYDFSMQDA